MVKKTREQPKSNNTNGSSLEDYSQLIDVTNKDLRLRGHKASLEVRKDRFYIRGTFPVGNEERKRASISTGIKASIKGVALAETRLLD